MNTRVHAMSTGIEAPRGGAWIAQVREAFHSLRAAMRASAAARRRVRDIVAVREYARQVENIDPGLASDLRAAADRQFA